MTDQFDISSKRVVITGGSGGIGSGLVSGFLDAGTRVVVSVRDSSQIEEVKRIHGSDALSVIVADLNDPQKVSTFVDQASESLGGIDVLIAAHGNVEPGPAVDMSDESWAHQLQLNLTSVFQLSRAVAPQMIERKSGKIINIASMLSFQGGLRASAYAAAKGGVAQLTKALANEWSPHGINVNAIAPGYIKTKLNRHIWSDPIRHQQVLDRLPSGRWGEPQDLIGPALFLASSAANYIHGVILPVDGGWLSR